MLGVGVDGGLEKRDAAGEVSHQAIAPSIPSTVSPSIPLAQKLLNSQPKIQLSQPELLDIRQTFALSSMIPSCLPEAIREKSLSPKKRADAAKSRELCGAPPYDFTKLDGKKAASITSRWREWAVASGGIDCAKAVSRGAKQMIKEIERNLEWLRKHDKKRRDDERYEKTGQYTSKTPLKLIDPTREVRLLGQRSAAREVARVASHSVRFCCTFGSAENAIEHYRGLAQKHQSLSRDGLLTLAEREHHSGMSTAFFGVVRILSWWRQGKITVAKERESRIKSSEKDGTAASCEAKTFSGVNVQWSENGKTFAGAPVVDSRGDRFVRSGGSVLVIVAGGELKWVNYRRLNGIVAAENALRLSAGASKASGDEVAVESSLKAKSRK